MNVVRNSLFYLRADLQKAEIELDGGLQEYRFTPCEERKKKPAADKRE
jgi:hypothetical protein